MFSEKHPPLNLSRNERVASLLGASFLLLIGMSKKNLNFTKLSTAGYLIYRGMSGNCPLYRALGKNNLNVHPENVNIRTSVVINQPRMELYQFWRNLENLPLFMKHLKSVKQHDDKTSDWSAKLPGGAGTIEWQSEIVKDEPGLLLGWQSVNEPPVMSAGKVEFKELSPTTTEVDIVISYRAPLGILGEKAARLINPVFERLVTHDIHYFKHYAETYGVSAMPRSLHQGMW